MTTALHAAEIVAFVVAGYLIGSELLTAWDRWQAGRKDTTR